jgi:hypothetical protein
MKLRFLLVVASGLLVSTPSALVHGGGGFSGVGGHGSFGEVGGGWHGGSGGGWPGGNAFHSGGRFAGRGRFFANNRFYGTGFGFYGYGYLRGGLGPSVLSRPILWGLNIKIPFAFGLLIDPDSCTDVVIEDCYFHAGDGGIAIKAGRDQDAWRDGRMTENDALDKLPIRDVLLRNVIVAHAREPLFLRNVDSIRLDDVCVHGITFALDG